jgi:hypothetical protein
MTFNFNVFKAKLILKNLTIKKWCIENGLDVDRFRTVMHGIVKPNEREKELIIKEIEE